MLNQRPIFKYVLIFGSGLVLVCGTILLASYLNSSKPIYVQYNTGTDGKPVNNITVQATGKVSVEPDLAMFNAGYTIERANILDLQSDLNTVNDRIVKALRDNGVDEKDLKTITYLISPSYRYDSDSGESIQNGFEGTIMVSVKVRDLDKTGKLIEVAMDAGANKIENIQFTVENLEAVKSEARKLATDAAYNKAKELAEGSNVNIGGLIAISEDNYSYEPVIYNTYKAMSVSEDASGGDVTISSGSLDIIVTVNATYGIK